MSRARRAAWVVALYALEAAGLVAAGAIIVCALVFWRLSQGPVGLDFMREELEDALASALNGDVVSIGEAQASWRGSDRLVGIVLTDVVVAEEGGVILARAPRLAVDLSFAALLRREIAFSRVVIEGGEASLVRNAARRISAGLGAPDQVAARVGERPSGQPLSLVILREAIEAQGSMTRDLRELRFEGATLYLRDEVLGINWTAEDATLRVARDSAGIRAEASGAGEGGMLLRLSARAGPGLRQALFELELENATPARLFPREGPLAALASIELPLSATASAAVDESRGLLAADVDLSLGAGRFHALERDAVLRSATARLTYDPALDVATLIEATIDADLLAARLSGRMEGLRGWLMGGEQKPLPLGLRAEGVRVDLQPIFAGPLDATAIEAAGVLEPWAQRVALDRLEVHARGLEGQLAGEARLERVSDGRVLPSIKLAGGVDGQASVADVLDYWPVDLADGARVWVSDHVTAGRASNMKLDLDLPAEALVAGRLDDEKLSLAFDFADARTAFISTMSPLTRGRGSAVLRGNSFSLDLVAGEMAGLVFESGFVDIPRLNPKGALARFGGVARGDASQVLAFIDEPPLEFPSNYGLDPASITGAGKVSIELTRAMLAEVPAREIGFSVTGEFEGVSAPTMLPGLSVTDAAVSIEADPEGLEARAEGRLGPAPASIEWRETFAGGGEDSTRFHVETSLDAAAFDALGAPVRHVFTGSADLTIDAEGRGLDIGAAKIAADLTGAELTLPDATWSKPAGEEAAARLALDRRADGGLVLSDVVFTAPGAEIVGKLELEGNGRLDQLTLDRLQIERLVDAQAHVSRGEDGAIVATISGAYADLRTFMGGLPQGGGGEGIGAPLDLDIRLGRATLADGVVLRDVSFRVDHDGKRIRSLDFYGLDGPGAVMAQVAPAGLPGGPRELTIMAPDAGQALYAVFGVTSVRGGTLRAHADLPALNAPDGAPSSAVVEVQDFTLVGAPPLAQILASGSFEGLADTLAGEGIRFNHLEAPLDIVDGRVTFKEARAVGQALCVTVKGDVDLEARIFDLDGVLAPACGVNSVLGRAPVVGDFFVSRQGEGVFGLTYTLDGAFAQPRVGVNLLSALAPGVSRRMFEPLPDPEEVVRPKE
jgi:hypothetical protein